MEEDKMYKITSVCKEDIRQAFAFEDDKLQVPKEIEQAIRKMTDSDMIELAEDMADDYCNQLYWESLRTIFEANFLKR